ncbi:hypothetical protein TspCOW1_25780 [Thiohalobacter sp. COW1]|uniref:Fe2+/Pb2+ permease n=1 Tax=Thiohalobacter thiocyanaticus TaxID=585455 RepID=A0A1Z4VM82_9GAMM|nr:MULTISPECIES: FTR1 family protein [Thiohalobacter]BAZ92542.1 Fe2+/Pb2+ permease [Thiohalobacter thiocyanaticus]BCO32475.1 hypothetical protein TspCOW1_25780 [Thiohalobacter sp. COW1]
MTVVPRRAPDLRRARALFSEHCASCHGVEGRGNGALASGMEPAPTNFQDPERYAQRTLYGLYSTISLGVEDTGMAGYTGQLSEFERWSLAFLVGSLAADKDAVAAGAAAWQQAAGGHPLQSLDTLTTTTPEQAGAVWGAAGRILMAHARTHPEALFADRSPLAFARDQLQASVEAYRGGDRDAAHAAAVSAYLDGFELAEHGLDAVAPELRREIEAAMTAYRGLVRSQLPPARVEAEAQRILEQLDLAAKRLETDTLSNTAAFSGALVILLREGLEALLVVAALAAFLIRTERREGLRYLHLGWVGALLLGGLTWWLSRSLLDFSGASREITEGVAALVAMTVLFYVGFWMHNKTHARQWQRFIQGSVEKALSTGTLWALTGLAFVAVYREVFETILFYQAMWVQADATGQGYMLGGFVAAAGLLAMMGWLILRYSVRLPLRQFFAVTSLFMFMLAIVFAGKGVAALQEAGKLPVDPVSFPRIELLGIYPNLEGLLLQALLALIAIGLIVAGRRQSPAAAG